MREIVAGTEREQGERAGVEVEVADAEVERAVAAADDDAIEAGAGAFGRDA